MKKKKNCPKCKLPDSYCVCHTGYRPDEKLKDQMNEKELLKEIRDELMSLIETFQLALMKYGGHIGDCLAPGYDDIPCTCGFSNIIKGL